MFPFNLNSPDWIRQHDREKPEADKEGVKNGSQDRRVSALRTMLEACVLHMQNVKCFKQATFLNPNIYPKVYKLSNPKLQ